MFGNCGLTTHCSAPVCFVDRLGLLCWQLWHHQVDIRVGVSTPARPVAQKPFLEPVGRTPLGATADIHSIAEVAHDYRPASEGGCDNEVPFAGCHIYYIKVRCHVENMLGPCIGPSTTSRARFPFARWKNMRRRCASSPFENRRNSGCLHVHNSRCNPNFALLRRQQDEDDSSRSRWTCGPTLLSRSTCDAIFDLNTFRYIRQIQLCECLSVQGDISCFHSSGLQHPLPSKRRL